MKNGLIKKHVIDKYHIRQKQKYLVPSKLPDTNSDDQKCERGCIVDHCLHQQLRKGQWKNPFASKKLKNRLLSKPKTQPKTVDEIKLSLRAKMENIRRKPMQVKFVFGPPGCNLHFVIEQHFSDYTHFIDLDKDKSDSLKQFYHFLYNVDGKYSDTIVIYGTNSFAKTSNRYPFLDAISNRNKYQRTSIEFYEVYWVFSSIKEQLNLLELAGEYSKAQTEQILKDFTEYNREFNRKQFKHKVISVPMLSTSDLAKFLGFENRCVFHEAGCPEDIINFYTNRGYMSIKTSANEADITNRIFEHRIRIDKSVYLFKNIPESNIQPIFSELTLRVKSFN